MPRMDRARAVKAALTQAAAVAVLSIALAIALPHSFFDDYGWIAGPAAWALCSLVTARVLGLPAGWTLLGAARDGQSWKRFGSAPPGGRRPEVLLQQGAFPWSRRLRAVHRPVRLDERSTAASRCRGCAASMARLPMGRT